MFSAIERLCINCLRLIYIILLVNSTEICDSNVVLFVRVSCGAWLGAGRARLQSGSRARPKLSQVPTFKVLLYS